MFKKIQPSAKVYGNRVKYNSFSEKRDNRENKVKENTYHM